MDDVFAYATIVSNHPDDHVGDSLGEQAPPLTEGTLEEGTLEEGTETAPQQDAPDEGTETAADSASGKSSRLAKRFQDLTRRAREAEARALAAQEALAGLQAQHAAQPGQSESEQLQQAVALEVQRQWSLQQQREALTDAHAALTEKYPDFVETIQGSRAEASEVVSAAIQHSPARLELVYHFAKHPDELAVLNAAAPLAVAGAMRALAAELQAAAPPTAVPVRASQAPAPIAPVRGRAATASPNIDTMPLAEYAIYMAEQERKRRANPWS